MFYNVLCGSISVSYDLWLPYSSGCLISYVKDKVNNINWFEPLYKWLPDNELDERLKEVDLLCLTCYIWNHEYNLDIMSRFKKLNPKGITILGGPEIPLDSRSHQEFALTRPMVDVFVAGPGEETFLNIIKNIDNPFTQWNDCFGNGWSNYTARQPQVSPDNIPTPYLDNIFDSIILKEPRIKASFETNRGCPYKCAFCDWGGQANSKVIKIPLEKVYKSIDWIYSNKNIKEIEILDANFGMHRRDLETATYMLDAKKRTGNNPTVSYSGLVKNGSPYIEQIIQIIHNELGAEQRHLKLSFQTHSRSTLNTVLRDNIDNNKLLNLLKNLKINNIEVSSEMIIGLPGETAESWLQSQETDYNHGIGFMRTYILNLVKNTQLYEIDYRKKYNIKSKKILIPYEVKNFNKSCVITDPNLIINYTNRFESSEIIHQCYSFDINELVKMYRYFWYYHNFYNSRALRLMIAHLCKNGISISEQIKLFFSKAESYEVFSKILNKQDSIIKKIYRDEEITILDDYASYRFFSGSLRTDDLYQMIISSDQVSTALSEIFNLDKEIINNDIKDWLSPSLSIKELSNKLLGMGSRINV